MGDDGRDYIPLLEEGRSCVRVDGRDVRDGREDQEGEERHPFQIREIWPALEADETLLGADDIAADGADTAGPADDKRVLPNDDEWVPDDDAGDEEVQHNLVEEKREV